MVSPGGPVEDMKPDTAQEEENSDTLKYQLLGPSLTKAGQDAVDQQKVQVLRLNTPTWLLRSI
jgi:DNA polymerase kappa